MKIKNIFIGLLSSFAIAASTIQAKAETAYIPMTPAYECDRIDGLLCYDTLSNNDKVIYMTITYYGDWYMLAIQQIGLHNMMYVVNDYGDIVSQMMLDDQLEAIPYYQGEYTSDGNLGMMVIFAAEFGFLWERRDWL